jgi:hypothetical protein
MAWIEHTMVGYENPLSLTLSFTTRAWGLGLSIKQRRGQRGSLSFRVLLGKWHWCFSLG